MLATLRGSFVRVVCLESDVAKFAAQWPCFGTPRKLTFDFYVKTGDLVDIEGDEYEQLDDGGLAALSGDAWEFAVSHLGLMDQDNVG